MIEKVNWNKVDGLLPAIIQDSVSGEVLMLGYMNAEALEKSLKEGLVTFFSRTRSQLWTKGESTGHHLHIKEYSLDCDNDAVVILVETKAPTCHRQTTSCFDVSYRSFLGTLQKTIDQRFESGLSESYVQRLYQKGASRIAQKIGEEGVEVALASVEGIKEKIVEESADLLFHMLINLRYHQIEFDEIIDTLKKRVKS